MRLRCKCAECIISYLHKELGFSDMEVKTNCSLLEMICVANKFHGKCLLNRARCANDKFETRDANIESDRENATRGGKKTVNDIISAKSIHSTATRNYHCVLQALIKLSQLSPSYFSFQSVYDFVYQLKSIVRDGTLNC